MSSDRTNNLSAGAAQRIRLAEVAQGKRPAELVLRGAKVLNVFTSELAERDVAIDGGYIAGVAAVGSYEGETVVDLTGKVIVPGFIDGHIHLESSIVTPDHFAEAAVPHGTAAVICDPHEITNVVGADGVEYILRATEALPLSVYVMIPSCVPCSPFEENGAQFGIKEIAPLLGRERVLGLAEMMNYVGVINGDPAVQELLELARSKGCVIDGHAPLLSGAGLDAYAAAGIGSDHECSNADEAIEKLARGQWIMIREGTAAKNLEALLPLFDKDHCGRCMLVTDDRHPGELLGEGHIDHIIRRAIELGADPFNAYRMATFNPAQYFGLRGRGAVAPGYAADIAVLDDFEKVAVSAVYHGGKLVASGGKLTEKPSSAVDAKLLRRVSKTVKTGKITTESFALDGEARVIGLKPGELLTTDEGTRSGVCPEEDIVKIAVVERHRATGHIGKALLKGYGLREGAVAVSIAHDSHNIVTVGANDADMVAAVGELQKMQGGMAVVKDGKVLAALALPVGGLMCDMEAKDAAEAVDKVKAAARSLGVAEDVDPFMSISFVSLPVIPFLKLTTKGVVDVG